MTAGYPCLTFSNLNLNLFLPVIHVLWLQVVKGLTYLWSLKILHRGKRGAAPAAVYKGQPQQCSKDDEDEPRAC